MSRVGVGVSYCGLGLLEGGREMFTVTIEKVEGGYKIEPTNHLAKDQRETELWVRANFQVVPEEWTELKAQLDGTGKVSIERSAGKVSQVTA